MVDREVSTHTLEDRPDMLNLDQPPCPKCRSRATAHTPGGTYTLRPNPKLNYTCRVCLYEW